MSERKALVLLIGILTGLRIIFARAVGPGNDEAYHGLLALHLDWSYFDHPPMMATVARAGRVVLGNRAGIWPMRMGFIGMAAGATWSMALLTQRFYGARAALIAACALNATAYFGVASPTFVLPDGPLVFFWLLAMNAFANVLERPDRSARWVVLGLAWGGALLSKYHGLFLPIGSLVFLIVDRTNRRLLLSSGPYLALAVAFFVFLPVILWNANHQWASFAFQSERASLGSGEINLMRFLASIAGQAVYLTPWMWVFLWGALLRSVRSNRPSADRFFLAFAVPPTAIFLVIAFFRATLPHWSLIGLLATIPLLARDWTHLPRGLAQRRLVLSLSTVVALAVLFALQSNWGLFQARGRHLLGLIAPKNDPSVDLFGWDQVAAEINRRDLFRRKSDFLFTSKWFDSGQLAFALDNQRPVLCYDPRSLHNFRYWSVPAQSIGCDGVLVLINESSTVPAMFAPWFERIDSIGEFWVERRGEKVRRVRLFRCVNQLKAFDPSSPTKRSVQPRVREGGFVR